MLRSAAMAGVSVFGRPASSSIASAVLGSPSLNQSPSPSQPEHAPADGQTKRYAQLYAIASAALNEENDPQNRIELQRIVEWADRAISSGVQATGSGGAPVPNIQLPPPPPQAAAPGMPPAAPAGQTPGAPAGPPPPGAPPT